MLPSQDAFDEGGTAWGCAFQDSADPKTTYLYYSAANDSSWTRTVIGLAISTDGISFRKEKNPLVEGVATEFNSGISITPAVARIQNKYYMFFAGGRRLAHFPRFSRRTKIGVAVADDPRGPWTQTRVVASPKFGWEGLSIDLGPNLVDLGTNELLGYYSNSTNQLPLSLLGQWYTRYLRRRIGIFRIRIDSPKRITVNRYPGNPLDLNGLRGSPSESLFCPGYFLSGKTHYLLPAMSTYSIGFPFRQYIGLMAAANPYFQTGKPSILIDGPLEKKMILDANGEAAFDTPSPVARDGKIYLYYSAMDRSDSIWKTALTIMKIPP